MAVLLEENMRILALLQPELSAALASIEPVEEFSENQDEATLADAQPAGPHLVVMLGVDSPKRLLSALALAGAYSLIVIDHRPDVLKACLRDCRLAEPLLEGRLEFHLLALGNALAQELSLRDTIARLMVPLRQGLSIAWILAPHLLPPYGVLADGLRMCAGHTLQLAQAPRGHAPVWDVTVISPYCAIFDDLARCFAGLGLRTRVFRVPDKAQKWTFGDKLKAIEQLRLEPSRLLIGRNRTLFETERVGDPVMPEQWLGHDYVAWWWDVPNPASFVDFHMPLLSGVHHLAFAHALMPILPPLTQWVPAGARPQFVEIAEDEHPNRTIPVSFVGQTRLEATYQNWLEIRQLLNGLGVRHTLPDLQPAIGPSAALKHLLNSKPDLQIIIERIRAGFPAQAYFLDYSLRMCETGLFRMAAIETLLQSGVALQIWGDEGWLNVPGVTADHFRGILEPDQLARVYRQSQVNLNLNYMQVASTVNPKVLDVCAAGGLVITDERPELAIIYPDAATRPLAFRTLEELPELVELALHTDLDAYRRRVQQHTRKQHTLMQRAEWLARRFAL